MLWGGLYISIANAQQASDREFWLPNRGEVLVFSPFTSDQNVKKAAVLKSITLPFFDDFTQAGPYPNAALWTDREAYVNRSLALDPPTYGVATLDAYNASGFVHSQAHISSEPFLADMLTSQPIALNPQAAGVYLSFSYQCGGLGNLPEAQDSLMLQFFAPDENKWYTVWKTPGNIGTQFQTSILPVSDPKFMKEGFQFRFVNYCSIPQSNNMSLAGNVDFWHIDYVYLDANRSPADKVYHDISMFGNFQPIFPPFEHIPWKHYLQADEPILANSISLQIKNNDNSGRKLKERFISMQETLSGMQFDTIQAGAENIAAGITQTVNFPFTLVPIANGMDSARLKIYGGFATDGFDRTVNNTISKEVLLSNYYAYDDGSAEASYGIVGEGSQNAMFAYKFYALQSDSLRAVHMYFSTIYEQNLIKPFYLNVWESDTKGIPGKLIYSKEGTRPQYAGYINGFTSYELDSTIALPDSFFVGWTQTAAYSLNIGFDINHDASEFMYYNIDGTWTPSSLNGAVMMRPVFGKNTTTSLTTESGDTFSFYPNPANDKITIAFPPLASHMRTVEIISISGQILVREQSSDETMELSTTNLERGVYILRVSGNTFTQSSKLIINH